MGQNMTFTSAAAATTAIVYAKPGHPCVSLLAYEHGEPSKLVYQIEVVSEENDQDGDLDLIDLLERTSAKSRRRRTTTWLKKRSWISRP